ncbi:hypothetical protein BKA56DRAFT_708996, partial [Ilyonectria sp. MPI-CAGE-AT-0026]
MDNEHDRLRAKPGGPNTYKLCDLDGHNIFLACLPGQQGKGLPPPHDIRLGDVVVSVPERQHGGVVQSDPGKATDEGFWCKGFLWPPPPLLRSAMVMMRSGQLVADNKIDPSVRWMVEKASGLAIYGPPSAKSDVLFPEDYPHHPDSASCVDCGYSKAMDKPRHQRSKIHYELIARGPACSIILQIGAVIRETVYLDGGFLYWSQGLSNGEQEVREMTRMLKTQPEP